MKYTIPFLLSEAVKKNSERPALAFVGEAPLTYSDMAGHICNTIGFLQNKGITKGDKVALWGTNSPQWAIAYLAITSMGAVVVPILPETLAADVVTILNHSESKQIFLTQPLAVKLAEENISAEIGQISLESHFDEAPKTQASCDFDLFDVEENDLAAIIYTSGTTGRAKGVMLTQRNISHVGWHSNDIQPINNQDRFLSVLPLAHTYENSIGFLLAMFFGACIYYLRKAPTASVLMPAMAEVKPTLMLTVPLIIEKVYRQKIIKTFTKNRFIRFIYRIPVFRKLLNRMAGKKLYASFGGHLKFFGIGGAKLNATVEKFLREAKFPYAIGYGLTESSPLLAGANAQHTRFQSTGPAYTGIELKINNPNPETGEGEIWGRGPNVMKGYYKDPEMTAEVLTPDGWLKTGDLGKLDKDGYLYILGRSKNVIIGASGKNIYPEEIEALINNYPMVTESLVLERKGRLVALVQLNMEELEIQISELKSNLEARKEEILEEIRKYVNERVSQLSQLQSVIIQASPFEKTATMKIKRYLYA